MMPRSRRSGAGRLLAIALGLAVLAASAATTQVPSPVAGAPCPEEVSDLAARRQALCEAAGPGALIFLPGAPELDDEFAGFHQIPDFLYLTGVTLPDAALIIWTGDADDPPREILFLPATSAAEQVWTGPLLVPGDDAVRITGIAETMPVGRLGRVWTQLSQRAEHRLALRGEAPGGDEVEPVEPALHALRQVKSPLEVATLRRAIEITGQGIAEAIRSAEPGMYEYEIQAAAEYIFQREGALGLGFPTIAGSGPNTCFLHYMANRRRTEAGDLIVLDIGARYRGYTADITRTFPLSGRFTAEQREIYEIVLEAQAAAIARCRPGVRLRDVHQAALDVIRSHGYGDRFPHGTSHWLGLDVHDVGSYERVLEPGMVLTVEPGIYIPEQEIGVRVEDDVLVTVSGCEVLSAGIPKDPDAIEALMREQGIGNVPSAPLPAPPPAGGAREF